MKDFTCSMPTRIVFGRDAELKVGEEARALGAGSALVVYGGGSVERSGLLGRVESALTDAGITLEELGGVRPNPGSTLVREGIERARAAGADIVIAVGGGSAIDTAKAIAGGVPYDGDFWDLLGGRKTERALPVGVVLTTAASGSEVSTAAVITNDETHLKREMSGTALVPRFALMNPALTETLPAFQTAAGLVDIYSHLLEHYLTTTEGVTVSDRMIEGIMGAVVDVSEKVMADPRDYDARANIMWVASLAMSGVCGPDRAQDWASHQIEYALSSRYGCAHGAGLAVVMPSVLAQGFESAEGERKLRHTERLAQLAVRVWGCPMDFFDPERTARAGIARLRTWCRGLGMPVTIADLAAADPAHAGEDEGAAVDEMAYESCYEGGRPGTCGRYIPFNEDAVRAILKRCYR